MQDDFERSRDRWLDQEELRASLTGFGTNRQGQAIYRKHRERLGFIVANRDRPTSDKALARALKDVDLDRLLVMGITAAAGDGIGVDKEGVRNFRDQALWLGHHLKPNRKSRQLEFKLGAWGIDLLSELPVFALEDDGALSLPLTAALDDWLNETVERGLQSCPFIWPLADAPQPWIQVSRGGLSPQTIGRGLRSSAATSSLLRMPCGKRLRPAKSSSSRSRGIRSERITPQR